MVTDKDISAYHAVGWLLGVLLCTNVVCFESHLMCGLGLPLRKFLVSTLNYTGCELVHLHLNAISALNCFSKLCEC
jgi:hypothetical protein